MNAHTKILGYGLIAIGLMLVAVEASMMMRAGARNGIDAIDQWLFIGLGLAVAIGVAVLPTAIDRLARLHFWTAAACASFVWLCFMAYSMMSTVSVSAISRAELMSDRAVHQTSYADNRATVADLARRLKNKQQELDFLAITEPPDAIQGRIDAMEQNRRWTATSQCTNATTSRSRAFCAEYKKLQGDKALGGRRIEIQAELDNIAGQLALARKSSTGDAIVSPVLAHQDPEALIMASIATWEMVPDEKSIWSSEMSRYILVALLLLASAFVFLAGSNLAWPFRLVLEAFPPVSGTQVVSTASVPLVTPAMAPASPYMATKESDAETAFQAMRKRLYGLVRPTGPSAPLIPMGA